jgi:hypothetical protein
LDDLMDDPIAEKRANARISRRDMAGLAAYLVGDPDVYRRMSFWAWVGGTVTLHQARLVFGPNALNLSTDLGIDGPVDDTLSFAIEIPLDEIRDVRRRSAFFSRILVDTDRGKLSLRCADVRDFAEAIDRRSRQRRVGGGDAC